MKKVHKYKKVTSNNKIRERIFDNPPCKFGSQFTPLQTGSNIRHCSDGSLGNDLFLMQKSSMLYYQLWASRTSSGRTFAGAHNRHSSTFPNGAFISHVKNPIAAMGVAHTMGLGDVIGSWA